MANSIEDFSHLFLSSEKEKEAKKKAGGTTVADRKSPQAPGLLNFFDLRENPFMDSVNTRYFYHSKNHEEIYQKMKMCVEQNISLGLVAGQSGVGKTLITQMLLTNLDPDKYKTIVVLVSPGMTKSALLKEVLLELNLGHLIKTAAQTYDLIRILQDHVISLYQTGKRLVIMIDEAHFLESSSLHILRTISNIELPELKLVSILLFTEDVFLRRIRHESYNSLRNRMYIQEHLNPFSFQEMRNYVRFRITTAGGNPEKMFLEDTYQVIYTATAGIAREVNNLCYNAIVEAFLQKTKTVTNKILLKCL
jgi:type II secretory pathway predicted ATPase ExeA